MNFNKGDIVEIISHIPVEDEKKPNRIPYTRNICDTGIVVSKLFENEFRNKQVCISIPRYNGDYRLEDVSNLKKKLIPVEYKLYLIFKFGNWWFNEHKSIYQSILIEALK